MYKYNGDLKYSMNLQVKLIKKEQHRAVAPIIATLLMVAISVVGGILIFVFAQGFFRDTSIQSPSIDGLEIFGFNAKDVIAGSFLIHTGESFACALGLVDQIIDEDECFGIFIRNVGANPVIIETVKVFGVDVPLETVSGADMTAGKYCIIQNITDLCTGQQLIEPGQEVSLIVSNDESVFNGEIKIGRPIIFALQTGGGQVFTKQIRAGLSSGV